MEHKSETKTCQNCKKDFIIESDDFSFYEKIKVPAPTFCPHCRLVRRMMWRNERSLHKRKCDMCKKNIIAMYDDQAPFPVYCLECYKTDNWGAETYAKDYDFSKPFFMQWKELFELIPRYSLYQQGICIDSDFANMILDTKNAYLSFSTIYAEDTYFSFTVDNSKQIIDSYNISNSELLFENIGANKNYSCQYSYWSSSCINCNFILDCNNCQDCFGCVSLQNKRYCIENVQYTKEEYENKIKDFNMGSFEFTQRIFKEFWNFTLQFPRKFANIINSDNAIGDEIRNSNNIKFGFSCYDSENVKYGYRCISEKDVMDVCFNISASLVYEHGMGSTKGNNLKFIANGSTGLSEVEYLDSCTNLLACFACIGLKNKQYCILNKQYTKEEYFLMVEKIKQHMNDMPYIDKKGNIYKYGEFFPTELCPFGYNETVINDHFPLTKEEIIEKGYLYKEKIDNKYTATLKSKDLPDNIKDIDDSILNEVIECAQSGKAFKITPFEFQFYKRMNISIPRLHPDERYKNRLLLRNPMILYNRKCMHEGCLNSFETTYAPSRPEMVYCKDCYQQEVY